MKYLAYGANMDVGMMAIRCPSAKKIGTGVLKGYRLMFKGKVPSSYATIEPRPNFEVPFVLWEITKADERSLDRYEGFPRVYQKHFADVFVDGENYHAMYYAKPDTLSVAPPNEHYYNALAASYRAFDFDIAILNRAYSFACGDSF